MATPCRQGARPLIELPTSQSIFSIDQCVPIGFARLPPTPFIFHRKRRKDVGPGVPESTPGQFLSKLAHPLSGFGSLSEYDRSTLRSCVATHNRATEVSDCRCCTNRTFLGSIPFDVSLPLGAPLLLTGFPHLPLRLRPQDFSPSRRLAPPVTYRACFVSDPSLGFSLRGFPAQRQVVRPLERRHPLEVGFGT